MANLQQIDELSTKFEGILKNYETPQVGGTSSETDNLSQKFEGILKNFTARPSAPPATEATPAVPPVAEALPPLKPEVVPGGFGGERRLPGSIAPAPAEPPPTSEGPGVPRQIFEETGRGAATINKVPLEILNGFVRGLEKTLNLPYRAVTGDWESETPHVLSALTGKALEVGAPEKLREEAHPVTKFIGNLLGGLAGYMLPGAGLKAAGYALPGMATGAAEGVPFLTRAAQTFGSNLITFGATDVFQTVGAGGDETAARNALIKSIPTAALFTVAQAIPFHQMVKNPWMVKALESTATGTAFAGSHAMQGETDPAALAVSFLTGFGLHAITSGLPQKPRVGGPEWDKFVIDWKATNGVADAEWVEVQRILDQIQQGKKVVPGEAVSPFGVTPQVEKPTPDGLWQGIFGGDLGKTIEEQPNRADAVRALVPQIGDQTRAERFYDLYKAGDAVSGMREFPELSSWATEAQKMVQPRPGETPPPEEPPEAGPAIPIPAPAKPLPSGPMGVSGAESAEMATVKPVEARPPSVEGVTGPPEKATPAVPVPPEIQKIVDTASQTRPQITEHESIGGETKVNDVTYHGFLNILKGGDVEKARRELGKITANFSADAFDHYFNPLNLMGRMVDSGMGRQTAKGLAKSYEQEIFKPVREALANKEGSAETPPPEAITPPAPIGVAGVAAEELGIAPEVKGQTIHSTTPETPPILNVREAPLGVGRGPLPEAIAPTPRGATEAIPEPPAPAELPSAVTGAQERADFMQKFGTAKGQKPEGLVTGDERMAPGERPAPETPGITYHDNFPREMIQVNPDVWQHKLAETGAGQALAHIKNKSQWDAQAARETSLYRFPDGHVELMDGHSRMTAGDRVGVGGYGVRIYDSNVFTVEEARTTAALTNIRQGTGTVVDSAKAIRDFGFTLEDLSQHGIDLNSEHTLIATGLAKLSDPIFTAVAKGDFPAPKGAIIGEQLPGDHDAQNAIYKLIQKTYTDKNGDIRISDEKLRNDIRFAEFSKVVPTRQPILGEEFEDFAKANLVSENSDLMTYAGKKLAGEKNLFKTVNAKAMQLREAGNRLKPKINQKISDDAAVGLAVLDIAAFTPGSATNKLFKEFSVKLRESNNKTQIKEEFYAKLPEALEIDRDAAGFGTTAGAKVRRKVPPPAAPGELPAGAGGATTKYSIREKEGRAPGLLENAFGLKPQERPETKFESRLRDILTEFPDADPARAGIALRGQPKATNEQIALLSKLTQAEADQVARGNLAASTDQQRFGKKGEMGAQQDLFGGGEMGKPGSGRLFSLKEAKELAPVFYSQMADHLEAKLPGKGSGEDLAKVVEGWAQKGQFKADELKWSGLVPWLREQKGPVTKAQIADFLKENQVEVREVVKGELSAKENARLLDLDELHFKGDKSHDAELSELIQKRDGGRPKFQSYLTDLPESFTNRREILLTVPYEKQTLRPERMVENGWTPKLIGDTWHLEKDGRLISKTFVSREEAENYTTGVTKEVTLPKNVFKVPSSHAYGDPAADVNRFAHVFTADYVDPKTGKKSLVITEVQSDWAREGRSKGYKASELTEKESQRWRRLAEKTVAGGEATDAERQEFRDLNERKLEATGQGVPPLPFAKNWHEVALKRAIRFAAENGYSGVMVVNGEMVQSRYDLSKQVDSVEVIKRPDDSGWTVRGVKDGTSVGAQEVKTLDKLDEVIGKEPAQKVRDRLSKANNEYDPVKLKGLDLKIGGAWANNLYDKTIPNYLKKYVKQWGAEVGGKDVGSLSPKEMERLINLEEGNTVFVPEEEQVASDVREYNELNKRGTPIGDLHFFPITPAMQDSVLYRGQPQYKSTGRGAETLGPKVEAQIVRGLTTEQIQDRLGKNGTVSEVPPKIVGDKHERGWTVTFENGKHALIYVDKDWSLSVSPGENMGPDYARLGMTEVGPTDIIAGSFKPINLGGIIQLAKGQGIRTFDHENWHFIEHWLLTDKERAAVIKKYGDNEEVRARAYENWDPKNPDTIFQKIQDFFKTLLKALTGHESAEDVFAKARSGELFGREPMERKLGEAKMSVQEGEIRTYKQFKEDLEKDGETLYQRLIAPGSREIPLYEGERYYGKRAGNMIRNENGKLVTLTKHQIWERFYDPQGTLLPSGMETPRDIRDAPEGTIEPPPNKTIMRSVREKFAAASISEKSDLSQVTIIQHLSWAAREMVKASGVLDKYSDRFEKMSQEDLLGFTDAVESGRMQDVASDLQEAAQAWRRLSDGLHFLVADVKGGEFAYWRDYFPRLFKNPEMAQIAIEAYLKSRGRSMTGPEGFAKPRSQLLFSDSIKPVEQGGLGLEPLDPNYVTMMKGNIWEKLRFLTGQYITNDLKELGFIQRGKVPGWEPLQDKTLEGYFAHPDVARVLDNYLGGGLRGDPLFEAYNTPATWINTVLVGLSAFHATFSVFSDLAHGIGSNLPRALGAALTGRFDVAGHYLAELAKAINVPVNILRGGQLMKEYAKPGTHPEFSAMVDLMEKGGIRINSTEFSQMARSFGEALWDSKTLPGIAGMPRKMVNAISWPIMNWLVPRIKTNAIARSLQTELDLAQQKLGRDLTGPEQVKIAQEVARDVDDIFGQMVFDNLSMTRSFRDALRFLIGFPGWNIGSGSMMLESMKGIGNLIGMTAKAGTEILHGQKPTWEGLSRKSRMSMEFYVGMVMVMAVFGAVTNRLLTGQWSINPKDLMMPQTGATLPNGEPERIRPPTYMRDILSLNHPMEMLKHKLNFPLRMFAALTDNQDYFGEQIRDPYASAGEQAAQTIQYMGKAFLPFGVQGYLKTEVKPGEGQNVLGLTPTRGLNILGITPVPRQYTNTPAQNVIDEYNKMARTAVTSKQQAETMKLKGDLMHLAREGDQQGFHELAGQAVSEGRLTRQQTKEIVKESQQPPGMHRFTSLPLEWALRAWDVASSAEKEQWQSYFLKKVMSGKPETLIKLRSPLVSVLEDMGLENAAAKINELTLPEKATTFPLATLGVTHPAATVVGTATLDTAVSNAITANMERMGAPPKPKKVVAPTPNPKQRNKKEPFKVLGL